MRKIIPGVTDDTISTYIGTVLKHAPDRKDGGGRRSADGNELPQN